MKTGMLGIYDVDSNYANSLMEYISDKRGIPFRTVAFTELEALKEFAEKREIDILLISAAAMTHDIAEYNIGKIILLTDGNVFAEYISYASIYKYQSSENIIREVINYYVDISTAEGVGSVLVDDVEVIGVYSPIGRSGKTTFAITLGQVLAKEKETLYINMEEFSALSKIFNKEYSGDLSDLMYFYKQNPESLPLKLKAIVNSINEMDYIPPSMFSNDLRSLDSSVWLGMIQAIINSGMYKTIILDLSNMVKDIYEVLEFCNVIYMPMNDDRMSLMKISEFEEFIFKTEQEELLDKIVKVKLPICNENQWDEDYFDKQIWGSLGDFIRKLLKEEVA